MDTTKRFDCLDPTCDRRIEYRRITVRRILPTPDRHMSPEGAPVIVYLTCPNGHEYPYNVSPERERPPALTATGYGWPR